MAKKPATHFVVLQGNWRPAGTTRVLVRLAGETRAGAFADFDTAEADRASREQAARSIVNPFRCGVLWSDRTAMPEPVFRDFIADAGVTPPTIVPFPSVDEKGKPVTRRDFRWRKPPEPPAGTFFDWDAWWDAVAPSLSDEQRARVWEGIGRVRFFRVEERPVRAVAYAVVKILWNYNDMWYYPGDEGGETTIAYRTRERAEAECERLNAEARARWRTDLQLADASEVANPEIDPDQLYQFDMQSRAFPGAAPFAPRPAPPPRVQEDASKQLFAVDEVPFHEVVEIELPEGE
jgi:hypothetical protein